MNKISLIIDRRLLVALMKDATWSNAYLAALQYYANVIAAGTDAWSHHGRTLPLSPGHDKELCRCHRESDWLGEMHQHSRIEVRIFLEAPFIKIEFRFRDKEEKTNVVARRRFARE